MHGGTTPRARAKSGGEQDLLTSWRRLYGYLQRPGTASAIKRKIRRRERHTANQELRNNVED